MKEEIAKILGKFPRTTKIPLQGNGMAAISKSWLTLFFVAKTPWSWGRMYDVLSEGCEIEPRRQLNEKIAIALIETNLRIELEMK